MKTLFTLVLLMAAIVPSLATEDIPVNNDPALNARLNRVGAVVNRGVQEKYPDFKGRLTFRVEDSQELNACAYPDGRIYVTTGMMNAVKEYNDELAAVLNHEATHVAQHHAKSQTKKAIAWRGITLLASRASGASKGTSDTISQVLTGIAMGGYSRKDERRADAGSVELCQLEGYDPYATMRVMETLKAKLGNGEAGTPLLGWFAKHPVTGSRISASRKKAEELTGSVGKIELPKDEPPKDEERSTPTRQTPVQALRERRSSNLGGVAIIVRDQAGGGGPFFSGSSEIAVKTTFENTAEQTKRFTIVDRDSRDEAWEEQDLPKDRMDPKTMPHKGKTVGAKYFAYITLNFYDVTKQGSARVGNWRGNADLTVVKAEIKGKVKLVPVEKSISEFSTDFSGSEIGYETDANTNQADGHYESRPAGQAVEAACRKAVNALVAYIDSKVDARAPERKSAHRMIETGSRTIEKQETYVLHIAPKKSEKDGRARDMTIHATEASITAADYLLFVDKEGLAAAKVTISRVRDCEIWGTLEYPYSRDFDPEVSQIRFMRSS